MLSPWAEEGIGKVAVQERKSFDFEHFSDSRS
jgi:hypothetical protein